MGTDVRTFTGTPTGTIFAPGGVPQMGTPIVIDDSTDKAYYQRSGGTVAQITGGAAGSGPAFPVGSIFLAAVSTDPSTLLGYGTWANIGKGKMLVGINTGDTDFGTLGGTGGAKTMSFTPSGTLDLGLYVARGSNAWPTGVPTFAGTTVTSTASVNWPAGTPVFTGITGTASVNWPAGVPTNSTVTVSVSVNWPAANVSVISSSHRHELPIIHTDNTVLRFLPTGTFGVGTSRVPDVRATVTNVLVADVTNSGVVMMSNTVTAFATATWPASVPQAIASAGHLHVISWPASVPQAITSVSGTVSWPASVPQALLSVTPAGVISWPATAPAFTGATGSGSGIFNGIAGSATVINPYLVVYMWQRTA